MENDKMLKAEETKILTIDDRALAVETLPEKAKQLIKFYDDWKQREVEARSALLMAQTAMQAMANQIVLAVKEDEEESFESAESVDGEKGNEPEVPAENN